MTSLRDRWARYAGVRVQAALIAAVAVGLSMAAGGALFVFLLHRNLQQDVDLTLSRQATSLAAAVTRDGAEQVDLQARLGDTNVVQLLDDQGAVVSSSPEIKGEPALTDAKPPVGSAVLATHRLIVDPDAKYRQEAVGVRDPSGRRFTVVVAQSLESAQRSTRISDGLILVGAPLLVMLVASLTYWLAGRSLRSVERMRRQVAGIDGANLDARVPLPEAHDEVWRLAGTLNQMLGRLESSARSQRQFVSDASHELRSPLATLRATVEVAQAHPVGADWPATAELVLDEATRVERLVADLLLLATSDETGLQLRRTEVDLDDLVAQEAQRVRGTTGLAVVVHVRAVRVLGDRERLARVLRNLVDNAVRHATSTVGMTLGSAEGYAVLDITDDGPGVPESDRERVFDRFVRLDDARSRGRGGTGLGLAIVHQIVHAHGGEVSFVDSSRVRVTIPLPQEAP